MSPSCRLNIRQRLLDPRRKRELNEDIFSIVARRYDRITRLLSFHRDQAWKRRLVDGLPALTTPMCLDLACGTGDITLRLASKYPQGQIIGLDLSEPMLELARARGSNTGIQFRRGDMGRTGLASASFDMVTGGYALRNAGDLPETLAEIHRVLKPGGIGCFLDFSKPRGRRLQHAQVFLLRVWGGLWGWLFHGDPGVYTYIAESLANFPDRRQLVDLCRSQGFEIVASKLHFFGIVQRLTIRKPARHPVRPANSSAP